MLVQDAQRRLVLHGSIVLLIGLSCGIPAVVEVMSGPGRMWQGAHAALLTLGVWLLAAGGILPLLTLADREAAGLRGSLLIMAYSFTFAVLVQAVTGTRSLSPGGGALGSLVFAANLSAVLGAFVSAALIGSGAANALRLSRAGLATATGSALPERT